MKEKLIKNGILIDDVLSEYQDINEYLKAVAYYLNDEFFDLIPLYLDSQDYEMAKDALKGLYILAFEFRIMELYQAILEIYQMILEKNYQFINQAKQDFIDKHLKYKELISCMMQ